jgi:ATP-dependent DNA helicase RecG
LILLKFPGATPAKLLQPHPSLPANPLLADPLYLNKYIEKAGSGTLDMADLCKDAGLEVPEFRIDAGCFVVTIRRKTPQVTPQGNDLTDRKLARLATALGVSTPQVTAQVATQVTGMLNSVSDEAKSRVEFQDATGMKDREHFRKAYLEPLVTANWLARTIPNKPTSRLQKYRLTDKGRTWLKKAQQ